MPVDGISVVEQEMAEPDHATAPCLERSGFDVSEIRRREEWKHRGANLGRRRKPKRDWLYRRSGAMKKVARKRETDRVFQLPLRPEGSPSNTELFDFLHQRAKVTRGLAPSNVGENGDGRTNACVLEDRCPNLRTEQFPDARKPEGRGVVRVEQPLDVLGIPQAPGPSPGRQQHFANESAVGPSHPGLGGRVEADLAAIQHVRRQHVRNCLPKDPLARAIAKLLVEPVPERKPDEARVSEGNARLESVRHAHAIVLLEKTRQISQRVPVHHLVCRIGRVGSAQRLAEERPAALAGHHLAVDQLAPRPLGNRCDVGEIRLLPIAGGA